MPNITEYLLEKSNGIIKKYPEVSDPTGRFTMVDDGAVECEVGEFLYGLIRVTKPERVLETGTYTGLSSLYMAQALKDNGFGKLTTLEIENTHKMRAEKLWSEIGVAEYVKCELVPSLEAQVVGEIGVLFLDSEPEFRFKELIKFMPNLKPGGYVLIHDLHPHMHQIPNEEHGFAWPYGEMPLQIKSWVRSGELRPIHFPTPRGLSGFYKPSPEDYEWSL